MAFGKDKARLGNMNLRQQMRQSAKKPARSSERRGAPYYLNSYQPPVTGPADIIRLLPGEFPLPRIDYEAKDYARDPDTQEPIVDIIPYYKYISYFSGAKNKSCIGSEGWLGEFKGKGQPCVAADWFWWEWRERQRNGTKKPKSMSRSEKFVFSVLIEAPFYKVPQIDKNSGKIKVNEATKEPYTNWVKGSKRGNDEYAAAGYERKEGHRQHWSLPMAHWQVLSEFAESLSYHCRSCGGKDTIEDVALVCRECGEAIVEYANTALSDEDLKRLRNEEVQCPACKHMGFLEDIIRCTNCDNGEQATLFDFDLEVKRVPTSDDPQSKQTSLQILRAIGPRQIPSNYGEDLRKPLPLDKIFTPTPLEEQRSMFGTPPDDTAEGRQPSTRNASRQQTPPEDEQEEKSDESTETQDYDE